MIFKKRFMEDDHYQHFKPLEGGASMPPQPDYQAKQWSRGSSTLKGFKKNPQRAQITFNPILITRHQ